MNPDENNERGKDPGERKNDEEKSNETNETNEPIERGSVIRMAPSRTTESTSTEGHPKQPTLLDLLIRPCLNSAQYQAMTSSTGTEQSTSKKRRPSNTAYDSLDQHSPTKRRTMDMDTEIDMRIDYTGCVTVGDLFSRSVTVMHTRLRELDERKAKAAITAAAIAYGVNNPVNKLLIDPVFKRPADPPLRRKRNSSSKKPVAQLSQSAVGPSSIQSGLLPHEDTALDLTNYGLNDARRQSFELPSLNPVGDIPTMDYSPVQDMEYRDSDCLADLRVEPNAFQAKFANLLNAELTLERSQEEPTPGTSQQEAKDSTESRPDAMNTFPPPGLAASNSLAELVLLGNCITRTSHDYTQEFMNRETEEMVNTVMRTFNSTNIDMHNNGRSLLRLAARYGHIDFINFLVDNQVNINVSDDTGMTALHAAIWFRQDEAAYSLLNFGASVEESDENGYLPIHAATAVGACGVVRRLLSADSTVDQEKNKEGDRKDTIENSDDQICDEKIDKTVTKNDDIENRDITDNIAVGEQDLDKIKIEGTEENKNSDKSTKSIEEKTRALKEMLRESSGSRKRRSASLGNTSEIDSIQVVRLCQNVALL